MGAEAVQRLGKYELAERIGRGGYGVVWKGYDPDIKRWVAIKVCETDHPEVRERFFREAEIAGRLDHPNIVRIYDLGVEDGAPYLVQEILEGEDLDRKLRSGAPFPYPEKLRVLHEAALGLAYAHSRSVIHRDVKPSNLRVLPDGTVKIMDFGIAKLTDSDSSLTQAGLTLGTAAYLAPEQIRGDPVDVRTDIFSFGAVAFELLGGRPPFGRETISATLFQILNDDPEPATAVWQACSPAARRLVERCLQKHPEARFQSATALAEALAALRREAARGDQAPPEAATRPVRLDTTPIRDAAGLARLRLETTPHPYRSASAPPRRGRGARLAIAGAAALALVGLVAWRAGPDSMATAVAGLLGPASLGSEAAPSAPSVAGATPRAEDRPAAATAPGPEAAPAPADLPAVTAPAPAAAPSPAPAHTPPASAPVATDPFPATLEQPPVPAPPRERAVLLLPRAWSPRLALSVDGGAPIRLDRPRALPLEPGEHELTFVLSLPGYSAARSRRIELAPGERRREEIPIPPPGMLTVQARLGSPQALVRIDDDPPRPTPLRRLLVSPGSHRLTFESAAGGGGPPSAQTDVRVRSAREIVVTFDIAGRQELSVRERPLPRD